MHKIIGFTLIEFLISSLIGAFLMLSLMEVYLNIKCESSCESTLADLQERGRFLTDYLAEKIKKAGYVGCVDPDYSFDASHRVSGSHDVKGDTLVLRECMVYRGQEQFLSVTYRIVKTGRQNQTGHDVYSLYEKPSAGAARELVANVSQFRVHFGLSTSDGKNVARYVNADEVSDWNLVKSIELVMQLEGCRGVLQRAWSLVSSLPQVIA